MGCGGTLLSSLIVIVRVIKYTRFRWAGNVAAMGKGRSALKVLTAKPTGKRIFGSPRLKLKNNAGMDMKEIGANTRNRNEFDPVVISWIHKF